MVSAYNIPHTLAQQFDLENPYIKSCDFVCLFTNFLIITNIYLLDNLF